MGKTIDMIKKAANDEFGLALEAIKRRMRGRESREAYKAAAVKLAAIADQVRRSGPEEADRIMAELGFRNLDQIDNLAKEAATAARNPVTGEKVNVTEALAVHDAWIRACKTYRSLPAPERSRLKPEIVAMFDRMLQDVRESGMCEEAQEEAVQAVYKMRREIGVDDDQPPKKVYGGVVAIEEIRA